MKFRRTSNPELSRNLSGFSKYTRMSSFFLSQSRTTTSAGWYKRKTTMRSDEGRVSRVSGSKSNERFLRNVATNRERTLVRPFAAPALSGPASTTVVDASVRGKRVKPDTTLQANVGGLGNPHRHLHARLRGSAF